MGKTAETVIVLSFAYFSQFPPQFSPRKLRTHCSNNAMEFYLPCSAPSLQNKFSTYITLDPLSTAAETSAVLSFAYLSQFPPQFSPCENCALIVQTTLWHFSSLVPPLPLQNKFFYLHYASTSIHSCGNFRYSLIRILLAVSAAVFALRKLRTHCSNNAMALFFPCSAPPLTEQVFFYLHYARSSIHSG